jgi:hypothetical protein
MIPVPAVPARNLKNVAGNNMYKPYSLEKFKKYVKKYYPDKAEQLLKDPVHLWRATTGLELIHKEPTLAEQKRIWRNWQKMTAEMKAKSDAKSKELFGQDNATHNKDIMRGWKNKLERI